MLRRNAGWFSGPHTCATDRICVVVFVTSFVNSGTDFQPQDAVAVGPGGYLKCCDWALPEAIGAIDGPLEVGVSSSR
jgi:hypothetical protein